MLEALRRPVPLPWLLAGGAGAALAVALYCMAYSALVGRPESLGQSLGWAIVNVVPWMLAIEVAKRATNWAVATLAVVAAAIASLALGWTIAEDFAASFEAVRRLPPMLAVAALTILLRSPIGAARRPDSGIPLLPRQIDWVRAAGNYVELRSGGRTIVHRSSIKAAERDLARHGFVRIHRSILVRRARIARVRPDDVVLDDGTHLKIGKRYRAALEH